MKDTLVDVRGLNVSFPVKNGFCSPKRYVRAVNNVSLSIRRGDIVGLAGESGSGKSTIGKAILRLIPYAKGVVRINGEDVLAQRVDTRKLRHENQIIFQDPLSSLNPHKTVQDLLETPLRVHGISIAEAEIEQTLKNVGLTADVLDRYPHEFSGGQLQRICIARSLLLKPQFLVCDEAVASLDVSIQSQIINLFKELQSHYHLTYLFISHNIALLKYLCDEIGVLYLGEIVEYAKTEELFENPRHPYTQALLRSIPVPDPEKERIRELQSSLEGEMPNPLSPPLGCPFSTRCPVVLEPCKQYAPAEVQMSETHRVRCWRCNEEDNHGQV